MRAHSTAVRALLVIIMLGFGSVRGFRVFKTAGCLAHTFYRNQPRPHLQYQTAKFRCGQVKLDLSKSSDQDRPENKTIVDFESIGAAGNLRLNKDRESPVVDSNVNFAVKKSDEEESGNKPSPGFEQV